jgi:hypothetical protein
LNRQHTPIKVWGKALEKECVMNKRDVVVVGTIVGVTALAVTGIVALNGGMSALYKPSEPTPEVKDGAQPPISSPSQSPYKDSSISYGIAVSEDGTNLGDHIQKALDANLIVIDVAQERDRVIIAQNLIQKIAKQSPEMAKAFENPVPKNLNLGRVGGTLSITTEPGKDKQVYIDGFVVKDQFENPVLGPVYDVSVNASELVKKQSEGEVHATKPTTPAEFTDALRLAVAQQQTRG